MNTLKSFLRIIAVALFFSTPYISMLAARVAYTQRGYFAIGGEFFVPLLCDVILFVLIEVVSTLDKGVKR